jgi:lipopolysaccharide transport system ATP-binding protein
MSRVEIRRKYDEIVDFSGIEKFLDTPVKRYSSGMYVRLAFAVAAHLEPEILVIDEVLAVGDAEFQKKCLGKMETVGKSGRTVLFVSHDMNAVERLCPRTLILKNGMVSDYGETSKVISEYLGSVQTATAKNFSFSDKIEFTEISFPDELTIGDDLEFSFSFEHKYSEELLIIHFCLMINSEKGVKVALYDLRPFINDFRRAGNTVSYSSKIKGMNLVEGTYSIDLFMEANGKGKHIYDVKKIRIKPRKLNFGQYNVQDRGVLDLTQNYENNLPG